MDKRVKTAYNIDMVGEIEYGPSREEFEEACRTVMAGGKVENPEIYYRLEPPLRSGMRMVWRIRTGEDGLMTIGGGLKS